MLGWRNLQSYQQLDLYYKWEKNHTDYLTDKLRKEYKSFSDHTKDSIVWRSDFATNIGFPLFLAIIFLILFAEPKNVLFVIAIIVGLGFLIRWFLYHVAEIACQEFFVNNKNKILYEFIDQIRSDDICKASSAEEIEDIVAFYDYCKLHIVSNDFKYYQKIKKCGK